LKGKQTDMTTTKNTLIPTSGEHTPKQHLRPPWKPGESGNPAGRPLGARSRLSEAVLADVAADWAIGGAETIARVRATDPAVYFRVIASILPKDVLLSVQQAVPGNLDADSYAALRSLLDVIQRTGIEGGPQQVFEMIEHDLRARVAKPI
jgi:hypothetical protein